MKVIITGGRTHLQYQTLLNALDACGFADKITTLLYGGHNGIEQSSAIWAEANKIKIKDYTVHDGRTQNWKESTSKNLDEMIKLADRALVVWSGVGTDICKILDSLYTAKIPVYQYVLPFYEVKPVGKLILPTDNKTILDDGKKS